MQVKFVLLSQPRLPESASDSLDFVILYDVLVHVDLHITNKYIREIARVIKPGGKAFLSTANFLSPGISNPHFVSLWVPTFRLWRGRSVMCVFVHALYRCKRLVPVSSLRLSRCNS